MSFIVEGAWLGRPVRVSWRDGVLLGPEGLADLLRYHAYLRRQGLGPPLISSSGRRHDHDALGDHEGALLLIHQLLDHVDRVVSTGPQDGEIAVSGGTRTAARVVGRHLRLA